MRRSKIVVIESDPSIRSFFDEVLHEEGYKVQLIEPQALSAGQLVAASPDLVMLEINSISSAEVLSLLGQLRDQPDTARLPVLLSTTDHMLLGERATELDQLGCEMLLRPFGLDEFLNAVDKSLARGEASRSGCAV